MKKKTTALICLIFSLSFLVFVFRITDDIANAENNILKSPNVLDVTELLSSSVLVTKEELPMQWTQSEYKGQDWTLVNLPRHRISEEQGYADGAYAYYRIHIPKQAFSQLKHLKGQTFLGLQYIFFKHLDIYVNGKHFAANTPNDSLESIINIPVENGVDNIVAIRGLIKAGDSTGIEHRGKLFLGKGAELNELHRKVYKGMTVFQLVFILSKGSILFVFTLIYLLLNVHRSFDKFLLFGVCAVLEEVLAGDYLYAYLDLHQQLFLFNLVNAGAVFFLALFFSDLFNLELKAKRIRNTAVGLFLASVLMTIDALYTNYFFSITLILKLWNVAMVSVLLFFAPRMFRTDKVLFYVTCLCIGLTLWSTVLSRNVGLNMKAYGNLLMFFMVAYQTFVLFRREQLHLQEQERKLLEQEKDVAIGKTASLLAHDVRRPMDLMRMVIKRLSKGDFSKEFLEVAMRDLDFSINSATNQINDILNYSRVSKVELSEVSLYQVLAGAIKQVMTIHSDLDLTLKYEFKARQTIWGDESRLSSVLTNLISNAVEAIRFIGKRTAGEIKFSTTQDHDAFIFKIYNDGPHIPEDVIDDIFTPLFTSGKPHGTGLGLASALKAIQEHQGTIQVQNLPEGGVEFSVSLKSGQQVDEYEEQQFFKHSAAYGQQSDRDSSIDKTQRPLRIFLLDDDPQIFEYFEFLVTKLPFAAQLSHAANYEMGQALISNTRFDLYILDFDLAGEKNGWDFYQEHLHYLGQEVLFQTTQNEQVLMNSQTQQALRPLDLDTLIQYCEEVYAKRTKLLLVDDSHLTRLVWERFHGKHNIQLAASPEEALHILQSTHENFEYCIVDFYFDNSAMTGEKLARRILELNIPGKVIISSGIAHKIPGFISIQKDEFEVRKLKV